MSVDWITRADRLSALPPYIFDRLNELKAGVRELGVDLIDLGMGNPDGFAPKEAVEAAIAAFQTEQFHGYPPFEGTASFRNAITTWYHRRYGVELDPGSEALPLLGSKEGLAHLALAYVNPGDTVLVPSPTYPAHFRGPLIAGGNIHEIILKPEQDWVIDLDSIPEAIAREAKILYFNYPSNPTTATAPRSFFEEVVAWAKQYQVMLVHDLCYAELSFEGYQPTSLLEISGGNEIGVEFHTLSKTYNMAGWRVGFVVGNEQIIKGLGSLKTNLDYGIFSAIQKAAEAALGLPDSFIHGVQQRYRQRRDVLIEALGELGWHIKPPKATMYLWVPCPPSMNSTEFTLYVMGTTGVVVTPGNAFGQGGEGYVRMSLIVPEEKLRYAISLWKKAGIRFDMPAPTSEIIEILKSFGSS